MNITRVHRHLVSKLDSTHPNHHSESIEGGTGGDENVTSSLPNNNCARILYSIRQSGCLLPWGCRAHATLLHCALPLRYILDSVSIDSRRTASTVLKTDTDITAALYRYCSAAASSAIHDTTTPGRTSGKRYINIS
jgi:hypothetical protein